MELLTEFIDSSEKWFIDQAFKYYNTTLTKKSAFASIKRLEWYTQLGNIPSCHSAACYNLTTLIHLHDKGYIWTEETCENAAMYGQLATLIYLHENGCPWDEKTFSKAAKYGHMDIIHYLYENGCPNNKWTSYDAVAGGSLQILDYLVKRGCAWNNEIGKLAASLGDLDVLKYIKQNNLPLKRDAISHASNLDILKYLHEECGQVLLVSITSNAARKNKLDMLKYVHERGGPMERRLCEIAAENGHLDILKYAYSAGLKLNNSYNIARFNHHYHIVSYIRSLIFKEN